MPTTYLLRRNASRRRRDSPRDLVIPVRDVSYGRQHPCDVKLGRTEGDQQRIIIACKSSRAHDEKTRRFCFTKID
jgi:hypothetical protein